MRLAQKLIVYALAVALLPLAATGFSLVHVGEKALRQRISDHQQAAAAAVAAKVAQAIDELAGRLTTAMALVDDVTRLTPAEREGLTHLIYRQSPDVSVAVLLASDGTLLAPAAILEQPAQMTGEYARHPSAAPADVERLMANLPLSEVRKVESGSVLMSAVYYPPGTAARVAVAVPCCYGSSGEAQALSGVEIAVRSDVLRVEGIDAGPASTVFVVDAQGRVIAHTNVPSGTDLSSHGAVATFVKNRARAVRSYDAGGQQYLAAVSPVGHLGWAVVVEQPHAVAFRTASRMRTQTLAWIFGTAALVLASGFVFAGRLSRVLGRLMAGARAFGEGRLSDRVEVRARDELGELAQTMNQMADKLDRSLHELDEWGRTLEGKVDERTRELEATQAQLLLQSKLAAVGQLGAGVAHELNNPLAGILGMIQLMLRGRKDEDPDTRRLREVETAAKRAKTIVLNLLRFSERGQVGRSTVNVNTLVGEVADMLKDSFGQAGVEIVRELAGDLPTIHADPGQLAQVLVNLLSNARQATSTGGRVAIRTEKRGSDGVRVVVTDTGQGIPREHVERIFDPFFTTKRTWTDVGLGLSVAYRIVADHGGHIDVQSEVGRGSTFSVELPLMPPTDSSAASTVTRPRPLIFEPGSRNKPA